MGEGNQKAPRRSLSEVQILRTDPRRRVGKSLGIHTGIAPSGDAGAASLAPDWAATIRRHAHASISLQIPLHAVTEW